VFGWGIAALCTLLGCLIPSTKPPLHHTQPPHAPTHTHPPHTPNRLLHPDLVGDDGKPIAADERRKWCDTPANMQDLAFDPDLVYTLTWYQHFFDMAEYKVHPGPGVSLDLCPWLCAQPIQLLIK